MPRVGASTDFNMFLALPICPSIEGSSITESAGSGGLGGEGLSPTSGRLGGGLGILTGGGVGSRGGWGGIYFGIL